MTTQRTMWRAACSIAVIAVALVAIACGGSDSSTDTTSATTTTTPARATLTSGATYVGLGSSFASGPGIPTNSTDCVRSDHNYASLVAAELDLALTDVSCIAATTADIVATEHFGFPPQITAVTADTKLITVTVGGNDIHYSITAIRCGEAATECTLDRPTLDEDIAAAEAALIAMIGDVRTTAPDSTIVLATYPRIVPAAGNCPALGYTDAEADVVRTMGEELEQIFLRVADQTDVVLVDPYAVPVDHTTCAPDVADRWTNGADAPTGYAYHPTTVGHQATAQLILEALKG